MAYLNALCFSAQSDGKGGCDELRLEDKGLSYNVGLSPDVDREKGGSMMVLMEEAREILDDCLADWVDSYLAAKGEADDGRGLRLTDLLDEVEAVE